MTNEKWLIDANEVIEETESIINFRKQHHMPTIEYEALLGYLKNRPTVEAVPVVHGHWEDGYAIHNGKEVYKSIDCSVCDEVFKIESQGREYWKERFKCCPFCGTKMDGDGNG